jgi:tripartite ATP-independent transporter DctP family solute receptor
VKKINYLLVIALLLTLVVSGCGQKKTAGDTGKVTDDKVYEIKISHIASNTDPIHMGWEKFKEVIEEKSGGRIKVTIFGNKQLSNSNREDAEKVQNNIVQMSSVPTYTLAALAGIDQYKLCDYPYLFANDEEIYKIMDGEIGQELSQKLIEKAGIKAYGAYSLGWVKISSNKQPIKSPEDLKGLKIRTTNSDLYMALIKSWGASPTPVNYGEVFTALQQGTVDGMVTTTGLYVSDRFYEVQKYMATVNPVAIVHVPVVNNSFYQSLPDDLKAVFDESMTEYLAAVREYEAEGERNAVAQLREKGMDVVELTPEQMKTFTTPALPIIDEQADLVGKDFIERIKAELGK